MANKFYTLMIIPERSSNVKKLVIPRSLIRTALVIASSLFIVLLVSLFLSIKYFSRQDLYKETFAKNEFLDTRLRELQSKIATTDSTLSRIQSFEQKLRVVANVEKASDGTAAMGAFTKGEMENMSSEGYTGRNDYQNQFGYKTSDMEYRIDDLQIRATLEEQSLHDLYELLKSRQSKLDATPTVWPVRGWVTSGFGYRVSPFTGANQLHEGLDIAASLGTSIRSPASGRVMAVDTSEGFGKTLLIDHGYGFVTMYGHNSEIYVKPGQRVKRGDVVAAVGNTGRTTGPHVHYELRMNGVPINPMKYILE